MARAKKSVYKMKGSPMQRNFPSAFKVVEEKEGTPYETVKDASNTLTKTGQGTDVTTEYAKKGNEATREHIASGGKVTKMPDGSLKLTKSTN
jgi:GTP cyclohydrolase III